MTDDFVYVFCRLTAGKMQCVLQISPNLMLISKQKNKKKSLNSPIDEDELYHSIYYTDANFTFLRKLLKIIYRQSFFNSPSELINQSPEMET